MVTKAKKAKKSPKRSTKAKASTQTAKKAKKGYKRGSLSTAIYTHFDKVGVDEAVYEECLKLAKSIMPNTKFNKYHLSWYKNKYRQAHE